MELDWFLNNDLPEGVEIYPVPEHGGIIDRLSRQ